MTEWHYTDPDEPAHVWAYHHDEYGVDKSVKGAGELSTGTGSLLVLGLLALLIFEADRRVPRR